MPPKAHLELTAAAISGSGCFHERNLTHWDLPHSRVGFNALTLLLSSRTVLSSLEHLLCYDPCDLEFACDGDWRESVEWHLAEEELCE